ncbi:MAG: hypothetical protein ACQXXJ_08730, partial [Candidatus Bathyarchaeia archaeon]
MGEQTKLLSQKFYALFVATLIVVSLLAGGLIGYVFKESPDYTERISKLEEQLATLNTQLSSMTN